MKTWPLGALLLAAGIALAGFVGIRADETRSKANKMLRHAVIFKFKADTTPEQIREVEEAFAALPKSIPTIKDFEWGTDVSVENRAQGYTHLFLVTFADEKGRAEYLPHAAHQAFIELVGSRIDNVLVFDYWTR